MRELLQKPDFKVIFFIVVLTVKEKKIQDVLPGKRITKCWSISCWQK